ncbi:MAG: GAF domain-containing protein [Gemmatimonadales bacterium]
MSSPKLNPESILKTLRAAFCHDATRGDLLQLTATKLHAVGEPYTGIYVYMVDGDSLVLEAFAGRPTEHTRIPIGQGLCGRAVAERSDIYAADVTSEAGYLACSAETRSEFIALIRQGDSILGQIDIDSDQLDGLDAAERIAVQQVAEGLAALL